MTALSFVSMYILMYAMVNAFPNVLNSINQVYMAGLMTAPMVLIELALMRDMYPDQRLNAIVAGVSVLALILFFVAIRTQAFVGNTQFLRSMIPHHSGAILMCSRAKLEGSELTTLCQNIIKSQAEEIAQMRRLLDK
ncbi:MAG: DUF305 domain-containing protein [Hyphomicrobiales bacterium]|nr:MAG: DUF305 domain-containing protein [Hyphomicrobiales bacterium]